MSIEKMLLDISRLSPRAQDDFIERLRLVLSNEEILALQTGIAYMRILDDEKLRNAMMKAMATKLYEYFRR